MKLRHATVLAALATAFIADQAHAQNAKFSGLDKDGDRHLSREEVRHIRGYDRAFDEADDNRDGKLDADEFLKAEAIHDRQVVGGYAADSTLTAKVKTALLRERNLKSMDVHVETDSGRVLLSGWVDNEEQRRKALLVASKVEGVKEVKDGMNVR